MTAGVLGKVLSHPSELDSFRFGLSARRTPLPNPLPSEGRGSSGAPPFRVFSLSPRRGEGWGEGSSAKTSDHGGSKLDVYPFPFPLSPQIRIAFPRLFCLTSPEPEK